MRGLARLSVAWVAGMVFSVFAVAEPAQPAVQGGTGFSTMLDVLIGFATVMLILSLIVTTLVQMTQSAFQLRARNLRAGIESFIRHAVSSGFAPITKRQGSLAQRIIESPQLLPDLVPRMFSVIRAIAQAIRSGQTLNPGGASWITKEELANVLRTNSINDVSAALGNKDTEDARYSVLERWFEKDAAKELAKLDLESLKTELVNRFKLTADAYVETQFARFEAMTSNRFEYFMRKQAIFWAIGVAVVFQVSTIDLVQSLSSSKPLRDRFIEAGLDRLALGEAQYVITLAPTDIADALERLRTLHPKAVDTSVLDAKLKGVVERPVSSYVDMVKSAIKADVSASEGEQAVAGFAGDVNWLAIDHGRKRIETYSDELAKLDLSLFRNGCAFYFSKPGGIKTVDVAWTNCLGVAITAAFISLGAPFWFNMLKNASKLRDAIRTADPDNKQNA